MKKFTLEEIAAACGGKYVGDESLKSTAISSVERDSRCIKENSLFLAIKGERVDGHNFIEKCYADGAVCAVCKKAPQNPTKPYILVDSTLEAVKRIAYKHVTETTELSSNLLRSITSEYIAIAKPTLKKAAQLLGSFCRPNSVNTCLATKSSLI